MYRRIHALCLPPLVTAALILAACGATPAPTTLLTPREATPTSAPSTPLPTGAPTDHASIAAATPTTAEPTASPTARETISLPTSCREPTTVYPSPFAFYPRGPGYLRMAYIFDTLGLERRERLRALAGRGLGLADDGVTWTFDLRQESSGMTANPSPQRTSFSPSTTMARPWTTAWSSGDGRSTASPPQSRRQTARRSPITVTEPTVGVADRPLRFLPIIPKHIWENVEDLLEEDRCRELIGSGMFTLTATAEKALCV